MTFKLYFWTQHLMNQSKLLFILILILITTDVAATVESGAYINLNIGYGYVGNGSGTAPTNNVSYSLGFTGGYSFNQYLALDLGSTFMPNNYQSKTSDYFISETAVRGSVPIGNFASAYLRLGPGMLSDTTNGSNYLGYLVGGGALFQISHHFAINIEDYGIYVPSSLNNNINIIALGLTYAF